MSDSRGKCVRTRRRLEGRELQRTRAAGIAAPVREWKHLHEYMCRDLGYLLPVVHCTLCLCPLVLRHPLTPPDGTQVRPLPNPLGPRPSPRASLQHHQRHKRDPKEDPRHHRASRLLPRDRLLQQHPSPMRRSHRCDGWFGFAPDHVLLRSRPIVPLICLTDLSNVRRSLRPARLPRLALLRRNPLLLPKACLEMKAAAMSQTSSATARTRRRGSRPRDFLMIKRTRRHAEHHTHA